MIPTVLTIAGSDPSGGAGIQADLKTMTVLGVHGAAAITCITVQNSRGVSRIHPLDPDLVRQQVTAVLADQLVTHIKIGMVGTREIAGAIAGILADFQGTVIYDPVMVASSGHDLTASPLDRKSLGALMARCSAVTPNIPELGMLAGKQVVQQEEIKAVAQQIMTDFDLSALVVTGGHGTDQHQIRDLLFFNQGTGIQVMEQRHPRLVSHNTHGTGCTFSSALAAFHCRGKDWPAAFISSVHHVHSLIGIGRDLHLVRSATGSGPLPFHL